LRNLNFPENLLLAIDGKQTAVPLLYGSVQFLPLDTLTAGRLATVLFSLGTLAAGYILAKKKIIQAPPVLVGLFLTFCPLLLFFDRMAMPDSIVTAIYTMSIVVLISLLEKPSIKKGILLGFIIALGWWFKSTVLLAMPIIFLSVGRRLFLPLTAFMITFLVLISPLLLHPKYQNSPYKDTDRLIPAQLLENPQKIGQNFLLTGELMITTTTPLVFFFFLIAVFISIKERRNILLILAVLFPIFFESFFLKSITSRYILLVIPLYLLLAIEGLLKLANISKFLLFLTLSATITLSLLLIFSPLDIYRYLKFRPHVAADFYDYFQNWTSGYGVKEAADFVINKSAAGETLVLVRDDSGNPEDGVWVYLHGKDKITFASLSKINQIPPARWMYFISRGPQFGILEGKLKEMKKFYKPFNSGNSEFIGVYQVGK